MKNDPSKIKAGPLDALQPLEVQTHGAAPPEDPFHAERDRLLHEQHIHQAELEAQNQALREAQARLEESRDRYADLYDFAPVGYMTLDAHGIIEEINLTATTLLGVARDRLIGTPFRAYVAAADGTAFREHLRQVRQTAATATCELSLTLKDRPAIPVQLVSLAVRNTTGKITRFRTTISDITERKQAKQALQEALAELRRSDAELERLNALKDQFLGMAAHDLRNPLAVIQSYSEFMLDEAAGQLDPEQLQFLRTIHSSSEFMARLINDLVDMYAIEAGRLRFDRQPTDLVALLERNVAMQRDLAEKKQLQLVFDSQGALPDMLLDGSKIEQALGHLISNAVKFSHPDSTVEVRVAPAAGQAIVAVQDHGQGIPPGELDGLFTPFARTSVKSTAGEKSTGLALVIARRIIEGHQGKIWVESQVGQGSTFFVSLPLQ